MAGPTSVVRLPAGHQELYVDGSPKTDVGAVASSPGCCTQTNSVWLSGVKYGPVPSDSTGMFAKRYAMPAFGPDVGTMNMALLPWYWYSLALFSRLDEMSVTTQRLPSSSNVRLSGLEKPWPPPRGGPPAAKSSQAKRHAPAGRCRSSRMRRTAPWESLTARVVGHGHVDAPSSATSTSSRPVDGEVQRRTRRRCGRAAAWRCRGAPSRAPRPTCRCPRSGWSA